MKTKDVFENFIIFLHCSVNRSHSLDDNFLPSFCFFACARNPFLISKSGKSMCNAPTKSAPKIFLITTQAKRNLSSRSGIGGVRSAT